MGKSDIKKFLLGGFVLLIVSFFVSFLSENPASAYGESFRWVGKNAIEMSGGSFNDMLVDGPNQSRPLRFTGSVDGIALGGIAVFEANRPLTINTSAGTCRMQLEIALQTTEVDGQAWILPANGTLRDPGTYTQADRDGGHESCIAWASGDGPRSGSAAAARAMNAFWNQACFNSNPGFGENEYTSCGNSFNRNSALPGKTVGISNPAAVYPALASQCSAADSAEDWNECVAQLLRTQAESDEGIQTGEDAPDEQAADAGDANVCRGGGLGWITCPFVALMAGAIEGIANVMDMLLFVEPLDLSTDSPMYQLWSIFRNIANVVFIIVFLVVIFSQVTSMGLSNYGIKSILPRLVIAAILVNVSYFVCAIAIDAFNILGSGIEGIMQAGINAVPDPQSNSELGIDWSRGWGNALSGLMAILIVGGTVLAGILLSTQAIPIILGALLAVALPVLIAFAIIVLRHVFIILLVLLSPLAFVSMLLPGTSNFFSKWQSAFMTILFMYPIIMLALYGSILGAKIILTVNYTVDWLAFVLALMTLAAGPAVIIAAPKLAGALLSRFTGFINNPSKGLVDSAKNATNTWRANQQGAAAADFKGGPKNTFFGGMRQRVRSGYKRTGAGKARNEAIVQGRGDKWEGEQVTYARSALDQQGILNDRGRLKEVVQNNQDVYMRTAAMKAIGESGGTNELLDYLSNGDAVTRRMAAKAAVSSPAIKQMGSAIADQSQAYLELLNQHPDATKDQALSARLWKGDDLTPRADGTDTVIGKDKNGNDIRVKSARAEAMSKIEQKIGAGYLASQKATPQNFDNIKRLADEKDGSGRDKILESMRQGLSSSSPETRNKMNDNFQKTAYAVASGDKSGQTLNAKNVTDEQNIALLGVSGSSVGSAIAGHYGGDINTLKNLDSAKQDALHAASAQAMKNNPGSGEIAKLHQDLGSIISSRPSGGGGAP